MTYDTAFNSTDYELATISGLADALYLVGVDNIGGEVPEHKAILALIVALREKVEAIHVFRNKEWTAAKAGKVA